jgi:hypothetical protein
LVTASSCHPGRSLGLPCLLPGNTSLSPTHSVRGSAFQESVTGKVISVVQPSHRVGEESGHISQLRSPS